MDWQHAPNPVFQAQPIKVDMSTSLPSILVEPDLGPGLQAVAVASAVLQATASVVKAFTPYQTLHHHFDHLKPISLDFIPTAYTTIGFPQRNEAGNLALKATASIVRAFPPFRTHTPHSFADLKVSYIKLDDSRYHTVSSHLPLAGNTSINSPLVNTRAGAAYETAILWKTCIIGIACIIFLLELYVNIRQWRRRTATMSKDSGAKNDTVKGRAAYNITHSLLSALRVGFIIGFNLIPWLWVSVRRLQYAFLPPTSERMTDAWHCLLFFAACGICYCFLHILDAALRFCFIGENLVGRMCDNWTLPQVRRNISNGRPVYIVLSLCMLITLLTKPFSARITPVLLPATIGFQLLYIVLSVGFSQPKKSTLSLMQDEVLVEAITELAAAAKFPLKNIYVSSGALLDEDLEEQGLSVCGWPRKNTVVVNKRMLAELTSEDVMALLAQSFGTWQGNVSIRKFVMSQISTANILFQLLLFVTASETDPILRFGLGFRGSPTIPTMYIHRYGEGGSVLTAGVIPPGVLPGAAALVIFAVALARPWQLYFGFWANIATRAADFNADKHAASLGYSSELSSVLTRLSNLTKKLLTNNSSTSPTAISQEEEQQINDPLYAILYTTHSTPQTSQRLAWLEEERVKEDMKEGCIRLPLGNEKL